MVTQGTSVQPADVVLTVQVGKMDSQRTPEVCQVCVSVCIDNIPLRVSVCISICACLFVCLSVFVLKP